MIGIAGMQRMLDPAENPLLAGGQAHQVRPGSSAPSRGGSWTKASVRRAAFSTAITKGPAGPCAWAGQRRRRLPPGPVPTAPGWSISVAWWA
jgi:hypothetical protein